MPGQPITLGPFSGGYANATPVGELTDKQLSELLNLNVATDGSLLSRGPIAPETGTETMDGSWVVYGTYRSDDSVWYALAAKPTPTGWTVYAILNGTFSNPGNYFPIKDLSSVEPPSDVVQYETWMYFLMPSGPSCFKWSPASGTVDVTQMPKGRAITASKGRLFVTATRSASTGSRVFYSQIEGVTINPDVWVTSKDYFDVGYGLGGLTSGMMEVSNSIYIFKDSATYRYSYSSSIAQGSSDVVSGQIGAPNQQCVVAYGNAVYVYYSGTVYELFNGLYSNISRNITFSEDPKAYLSTGSGASLSVVGDYLVLRVKNSLYAYSFLTRTWSRWRTQHGVPSRFVTMPGTAITADATYVAGTLAGPISASDSEYWPEQKGSNLSSASVQVLAGNEFGGYPGELSLSFAEDGFHAYDGYIPIGHGSATRSSQSRDSFDIITVPGAKMTFQADVDYYATMISPPSIKVELTVLLSNGATQLVTAVSTVTGATPGTRRYSATITVPKDAVAGKVAAHFFGSDPSSDRSFKMKMYNITLLRVSSAGGSKIVRFSPEYYSGTDAGELIEIEMATAVFDFGVAAKFKRLFWWGADLKSKMDLVGSVEPVGTNRRIKWRDLEGKTFSALSYGTWDFPLAGEGLDVSYDVVDRTEAPTYVSENGRYFIRFPKSLRFRQLKFRVKTSCFGNSAYGPVQVFRLLAVSGQKATLSGKVNA